MPTRTTVAHSSSSRPDPPPLRECAGVVLGVDGVITDTARLQARAWEQAFAEHLRAAYANAPAAVRPFDAGRDFRRHAEGRGPYQAARNLLASRGLLQPGEDGPATSAAVRELAARHEEVLDELLQPHSAPVWTDALGLVGVLAHSTLPVAAVSASHRAKGLLEEAGVLHRFDAVLDGGIDGAGRGGPDPALLREAARRLGAGPEHTAVVLATPPWAASARRAGFALIAGLDREDRHDHARALREQGAHRVVRTLAELIPEV